jgi:opacity protein-like surface antigen
MLNKMRFLMGMSAGSLALLLNGSALAQDNGFYLNTDLGPAWREKAVIKRFLDVANPGRLSFDTGIRFDIAAGYEFTPWLAAEIESGIVANNIQDQGDSSLDSVPLMFNVVLKQKLWDCVTPFIGAGAGGVISTLSADDLVFYNGGSPRIVHGDDADCVFGWQGFAGAKFDINEHWNLSLAYRYMWVDESAWDVDQYFGPKVKDAIKIGSTDTHAVVFGASFRF